MCLGDQQLRALELNAWQLLRLLQVQLPGFSCGNSSCFEYSNDLPTQKSKSSVSANAMFHSSCCRAQFLHNSWKSKNATGSDTWEDFNVTRTAYYEFIRVASEWLSHRASDV